MPRRKLQVTSALTLETGAGALTGRRWMDLLEQIEATRSISAAARAVPLSYKAAWDAVEAMNNLADSPLVERSVGGRGGGGARLTDRGRQLLATFRAVEAENQRFMALVNTRLQGADQDLRIIGRLAMLTSARNHFTGTITRLRKGTVNDEVEVALPGGDSIVAIVTHASVENLGLKKGRQAIALVKASSVIIIVPDGDPPRLSARNCLAGTVTRLTRGAVNTDVVIGLQGGNSVAAIITNVSARSLGLKVGNPASAVFKASSVILGTAP